MKWSLIVNLTTFVCCLIFFTFLFSIYFSKKNMNNIENKLYRRLLFITGVYLLDSVFFHFIILLYNRFYRSEENKDSNIEGTGLGLSITKSLVELMDGKITVNSNEGEGTTFTITLTQGFIDNNIETTEIL